ncbi:hypothetical protein CGRA01v4_06464 [Colletotrichum graminicola]|nr:hypothetical protein CGRA01v4_06464 [Colletotrichum graminicola]
MTCEISSQEPRWRATSGDRYFWAVSGRTLRLGEPGTERGDVWRSWRLCLRDGKTRGQGRERVGKSRTSASTAAGRP